MTPHEDTEVYGLPFVRTGPPVSDRTYIFGTADQADAAARLAVERNLWDVSSAALARETGHPESLFEGWSDDAYDRDEVDAYQDDIHDIAQ